MRRLFPVKRTGRVFLLLGLALLLSGCGALGMQAPEKAAAALVFMSDPQADPQAGEYSSLGILLDQALSHPSAPKLLLLGGDTVNEGSSLDEWEDFHKAVDGRLTGITVAAAAGNHDNGPLLARQFDYPAPSGQRFFYAFTYGNVFILVLDSNAMGGASDGDAQWVAGQLASQEAQNATWRIAVSHHPFWPVAEIPKDTARAETLRANFLPLLEAGGVNLILCGHQHLYARVESKQSPIPQIMAASGAKGSYQAGESDYILLTANGPAYLILEAGESALTITAYNAGGEAFDSAQIIKTFPK